MQNLGNSYERYRLLRERFLHLPSWNSCISSTDELKATTTNNLFCDIIKMKHQHSYWHGTLHSIVSVIFQRLKRIREEYAVGYRSIIFISIAVYVCAIRAESVGNSVKCRNLHYSCIAVLCVLTSWVSNCPRAVARPMWRGHICFRGCLCPSYKILGFISNNESRTARSVWTERSAV